MAEGGRGEGARKAQASVEYMLILAVAVMILTMIVLLAQGQINSAQNRKDTTDVQNALYDLSSAAKEVYAQGEGSKKLVFIELPSGYEANESSVGNQSIRIRAYGTDYVSLENFNVRGYLPSDPGRYWVWVASEGDRVRIGLAMMELSRNRIYIVMDPDSGESASITMRNTWTLPIDLNVSLTWPHTNVTLTNLPSSLSLDPDQTEVLEAQFNADAEAGGFYYGQIEFEAADAQGTSESVKVPVTVYVVGYEILQEDLSGPIITSIWQDPNPATKYESLTIYASASDEATGNHTIMGCQISADGGVWYDMVPDDGAFDEVNETMLFNFASGFSLGVHSIRAECTDILDNTGPIAYYHFNVSEADLLGPIVTQMEHTDYPTTLSNITVFGQGSDAYTGNSNISICNIKVDEGSWQEAVPEDGAWDEVIEPYSYNVGPLDVGYHTVYHQCIDSIGNPGGIFNDTFGVVDVDMMLALDRSGSMVWFVTNATDSSTKYTTNTGFTPIKTLTVNSKEGDIANLSVELYTSISACTAYYEARIDGTVVSAGSHSGVYYHIVEDEINVSDYIPPFDVDLYLRRESGSSCTVRNRLMAVDQAPAKMDAAKAAANTFVDIVDEGTMAGLASYSTYGSTDLQLTVMDSSGKSDLSEEIDDLNPSGSTCIECGLVYAADELTSARGRADATRVIVFLTDGQGNVGIDGYSCGTECSVSGAVYCRDRNITVYTIGFGSDVDDVELTNIALLTNGEYYFAPDSKTLEEIFRNIGK